MSYSREHGVSRAPTGKSMVKTQAVNPKNDPEAREKQSKAVDLRRAGASFSEIAQALGYHDASGAKKAVEAAIRRFEFEATKDVLLMDLARLDEWAKLATHALRTRGDMNQIDRLMRIMEKKHWLLGVTPATLAEANEQGDMKTKGGMNVVIASTERTFVRGMMQAVGMDPDSPEGQAYLERQGLGEHGKPEGKKGKGAGKKPRLKKKKPLVIEGEATPVTPALTSQEKAGSAGVIEGQVVSSRDEAMRAEAKRISVRPTDTDEVARGVSLLPSKRI